MLCDVLVRLEDSPETEFALGAALVFARGYGSTVTGLYVRSLPPIAVLPDSMGVPMASLVGGGYGLWPEDVQSVQVEGERQAAALSSFEAAAVRSGVTHRCEVGTGEAVTELTTRAACVDLVVMPRGETERGKVGFELEALVRTVGHPFLVASEPIDSIARIGVACDGSPGSIHALSLATDIVHHWKGKPPEVVLIEIVPSGREEGTALSAAAAYLDLYGIPCRSVLAHGIPGDEILAVADGEGLDLLCMGAYGHSAIRDYFLGSTTQAVIEHRRKPILLTH